ncbi:hypothetical protein GCM10011579_080270 [Streptomyces albiflavescens]|uniref:Uncharacterized protein n=1 Tax=Streptomyces albiflavescens TaxID=1623582 RepID=A0A917YE49_9ACTN|nr:hypothetical protein GCM10011579_080270 [Streptomyces albiflavescens]
MRGFEVSHEAAFSVEPTAMGKRVFGGPLPTVPGSARRVAGNCAPSLHRSAPGRQPKAGLGVDAPGYGRGTGGGAMKRAHRVPAPP